MKLFSKIKEKLSRFKDLYSKGDPFAGSIAAMLFALLAIIISAYCDTTSRQRIDALQIQIRELRENNYAIVEYLLINEQR